MTLRSSTEKLIARLRREIAERQEELDAVLELARVYDTIAKAVPRKIGRPIERTLTRAEQEEIRRALKGGWSQRRIARTLGIPAASFDNLIKRYGLRG